MKILTPTKKRRLEIQGFTEVDQEVLAETAPTTHFCIPSLTFRSIFGFPEKTGDDKGMMCKTGILCNR